MKRYVEPDQDFWPELIKRPQLEGYNLEANIKNIFENIQKYGDQALLNYTQKFDHVALETILASPDEIRDGASLADSRFKAAIDKAIVNITTFHEQQTPREADVETMPGVHCWTRRIPIDTVGLYIPGGSAPLVSTVLMTAIPAIIAGCKKIFICTPPNDTGSVDPGICYALESLGLTQVAKVGGAQAIAAMTIGTDSIRRVDKLFGPGNQYVSAAKSYAERFGVAMDMPAGPSEVMVVADQSANPAFVAADLLSQAEHGPDSQVVLLAHSTEIEEKVTQELESQQVSLPRQEIVTESLKNSLSLIFQDDQTMLDFANFYSPEHLILSVHNPGQAALKIHNAGSVFLGNYTPESVGDYASGTNHTLPTHGWARSYSGLSVESFCKYITFQSLTQQAAANLVPTVSALAEAEGLEAHKRAMEIRV